MQSCYAILFDSGLFKVGQTSDLLKDINNYRGEAKSEYGAEIIKLWIALDVKGYVSLHAEMRDQAKLKLQRFRNEYFSFVSVESARDFIACIESQFTECLDVQPSQHPDCIMLVVGSKNAIANPYDSYETKSKVKRIINLLNSNGSLTKSVIANRMRPTSKYTVDALIDLMVSNGDIQKLDGGRVPHFAIIHR